MIRDNNPGLTRRFDTPNPFRFGNFSDEELLTFTTSFLRQKNLKTTSIKWRMALVDKVSQLRSLPNFGNAGAIETCISNAITRMKGRKSSVLSMEDINNYDSETQENMNNPMSILKGLEPVGTFRTEMELLGQRVCRLREQGRSTANFVKNYVFVGNPGTVRQTYNIQY